MLLINVNYEVTHRKYENDWLFVCLPDCWHGCLGACTCTSIEVSLAEQFKSILGLHPHRSTAAFSQGLRSLRLLPPLPHLLPSLLPLSFLFSCQDCNQAFSLWPQPAPPLPTQKATNRLNYERNEGLKEKEANRVWETVIKNVALYADRTQV